MSYSIKQAPIGGRLGTGVGQGLSEQIPREIERGRLASGLKQFEQDSGKLNPIQQLARLSAIPGITPQMIQSFAELARHQAKANALGQRASQPQSFPRSQPKTSESSSPIPSLTKEQTLADIQEGNIPPTQQDIYDDAARMYDENPALFGNNPQNAIEAAEQSALRNEKRYEALKGFHETLSGIQDNVVKRLNDQANRLNVKIPANVYSKIEDEAIQATKPKKQGGRGLTEQQSMKEYGDKLDSISREYSSLNALSGWSLTGKSPSSALTTLNSTREKFKKRDDLDNYAEYLIGNNGLSPTFAYSLAKPVKEDPSINRELEKLPNVRGQIQAAPGMLGGGFNAKNVGNVRDKTLEVSRKLAPLIKKGKGSPYSIAYELDKKGYNSNVWLDYVRENAQDLDLTTSQLREFDKPINALGRLNDWWLNVWSGIDKEKK